MLAVGSERDFVLQGCADGLRADGRGCLHWRPIYVETDVIASASGSARVRIGGTDVVAGVKADLGRPEPERPDAGRLQFSVECSACAGPQRQGRGAEELNAGLTKVLERAFAPGTGHGLDLTQLSIVPGKQCWVLNVDALILGIDGSLADATSIAVKAALADTRVPMVNIVEVEGPADGDAELEVDDDPEKAIQLDVSSAPVIVTVTQVGSACLTDLTATEEACSGAAVQAVVSESGTFCGMAKQGIAAISPDAMLVMMQHAQSCGLTLSARLGQQFSGQHSRQIASAMQT